MSLFPFFFSPRLSKLPGWVSKDGTINLEKVGEIFTDSSHLLLLSEPVLCMFLFQQANRTRDLFHLSRS